MIKKWWRDIRSKWYIRDMTEEKLNKILDDPATIEKTAYNIMVKEFKL